MCGHLRKISPRICRGIQGGLIYATVIGDERVSEFELPNIEYKCHVVFISKKGKSGYWVLCRSILCRTHAHQHSVGICGIERDGVCSGEDGKNAIAIVRRFGRQVKNLTGEFFRARGYFVSTVWLDEGIVGAYMCRSMKMNATIK